MGGTGSGTWERTGAKRTTEDVPSLDVRELRRDGTLENGRQGIDLGGYVQLEVVWSGAGFGKADQLRPWFVCPGDGCGRRAAILYFDDEADPPRLACRACSGLAYPSQREGELARARRRAEKLRARLGPHPEVAKPKGMRHQTFVRLGREYLAAAAAQRVIYEARHGPGRSSPPSGL